MPLVFLIVAIIPGLYIWTYGTLRTEQATWGILGLNVLEGDWLSRRQPEPALPMYTWSMAGALGLPVTDKIWLTALPSFCFGLLAVIVIYLMGRYCFSQGVGLLACFLIGQSKVFLQQIHRAEPGTCILFWTLLSLLFYSYHLYGQEKTVSIWVLAGIMAFAGSLLCAGAHALWVPILGLLNLFHYRLQRHEEIGTSLRETVPTVIGGIVVVVVGMGIASPWLVQVGWPGFLNPWPQPSEAENALTISLASLVMAMPATIVLAAYGFWRALRVCVKGGSKNARVPLLVFWGLIGCLSLSVMPSTPSVLLFSMVPLTFLAVRTLLEILEREIPDRNILVLMLVSSIVFVFSQSEVLQELPRWLRESEPVPLEQRYLLHLGLDALVLVIVPILWLYKLTARNDRFRRTLFGGFVLLVVLVAWIPGLVRLQRSPRAEDIWVKLARELRDCQDGTRILIVGEPTKPLDFIVRTSFPGIRQESVEGLEDLESQIGQSEGNPLVLVTDPDERLPKSIPIARGEHTITLDAIYESPLVVAYFPIEEKGEQ